MSHKSVPIIDIEPLLKDRVERQEVVAQISAACREWGFFQITGHQIEKKLLSRVWHETKAFFSLPVSAKQTIARTKENARGWFDRELTKNARDIKEVFDFGYIPHPNLPEENPANKTHDGFNQWPDARLCPNFRPTLWEYFRTCEQLAFTLLESVREGLDLSPGSLTRDFTPVHTSFLRLNYYPKHHPLSPKQHASHTGHMGVHHHTDAGALTLLLQGEIGGLEIFHDGQWIPVEPVRGALVINIGDMVQVWTNDLYRAPVHRVLASVSNDRYSLPFFYNPAYDTQYAPLETLTNDASPPKYRPISWGEFRWNRQQGDFANYGQENQITDYRIPNGGGF